MNSHYVLNLLRVASSIELTDPVLAYELERSALAVINPGAKKFEQHVGDVVDILKGLKEELEAADKSIDADDAKEFAQWFNDEAEADTENLRQMLKVSAVLLRFADDETAGVMDKVKGWFKKDKSDKADKTRQKDEEKTEKSDASYQMDESEMDAFVEGKQEWSDGSHKVEKESRENKEFFEDAKSVQTLLDKVREKPSRNMVRTIIQDLGELIERGTAIMKGKRKVDKVPQADDLLGDEKKPADEKKPGSPAKPDLGFNVQHYTDMLTESMGDEKATLKVLKEFFNVMQPHLASRANRTKLLPLLVRTASGNPGVRPVLLPVIKRWASR